MRKNPSDYMIPLQFPTERYVYGPDIDTAHWTSSPVWSQAVFTKNNPAQKYVRANPEEVRVNPAKLRVVSGGKRQKLKKVPDHIEKTTRKHASRISAIGEKGRWPIGDLYHARLAMIYILSPSHRKVRNKVIAAVQKHYPEYDWQGWLRVHEKGVDEIEHMIKRDRSRMAANNPGPSAASRLRGLKLAELYRRLADFAARDDFHSPAFHALKAEIDRVEWESMARNNSPDRDMFSISRGNPMPNPVTGPPYPAAQYIDGAPPAPLTMPTNAGPFLPDMYPYGIGGRMFKIS